MIIKTEEFKEVCSSILTAATSNELSELTETLELKTIGKNLYLNVTNGEYYASCRFELDHEEAFLATVNAELFLKLVDKITTTDIELTIPQNEHYILLKANGNYKIPFVTKEHSDELLEVPAITIVNKTVDMNIPYDVLASINDYNTKELATSSLARPVQRLYYVDQEGCITFASGACVNSFTLEKNIKILLNSRLVKLFKLFKKSQMVHFELGYDAISDTLIQTKVCFSNNDLSITSILTSDESMINGVPTSKIRERANKTYSNKVVLNKNELANAIDRLLLFNDAKLNVKPYSTFSFDTVGALTVYDTNNVNCESVKYQSGTDLAGEYSMRVDLVNFKKTLDTCDEDFITISFGDHKSCVITRGAIKNVIPEATSGRPNRTETPEQTVQAAE